MVAIANRKKKVAAAVAKLLKYRELKRRLVILLLLVCSFFGYAQGVFVYTDDIYKALDVAKREQKLLLVEFYADWNYRSRWFNEMMSSSETVAKALDENFVLFRFDTNSKIGADYANRYSVNNYPYLLVFNRNGDVIFKIDKTLEKEDFIEILNTVLVQQNGSVVWRMSQIDAAIESQDHNKADKLFEQLYETVGDKIFNRHFWRLFEDDIVTFYGSTAYNVLSKDKEKFETDSVIVHERIATIFRELVKPFLLESQTYNDEAIKVITGELLDLKLKDPQVELMLEMVKNRNNEAVLEYIINCEKLLNIMDEDQGFGVVLSLEFVAQKGSKEQKKRAKKIVENQLHRSSIGSQTELLEQLLRNL